MEMVPLLFSWEGIFDSVGNGFVYDQSKRYGLGDVQVDIVDLQVEIDPAAIGQAAHQIGDQLVDIGVHIDERAGILLV